jgi:hypothetical protein
MAFWKYSIPWLIALTAFTFLWFQWYRYEAQIRNEYISEIVLKDGAKLTGSYIATPTGGKLQICKIEGEQGRLTGEVRTVAKTDIEHIVPRRDLPIDYGTGGIYNRQPARKVVSNDREWPVKHVVIS